MKYKIYCVTESLWKYTWGNTAPTVCPTNAGDTVDLDSVSELDGDIEIGQIFLSDWIGTGSGGFAKFNYVSDGKVTYAHYASSGNNNDGMLIAQGVIPSDFGGWFDDCGEIDVYSDGDVDSHDIRIEYDGTPDSTVDALDILPGSNQTFTKVKFKPGTTPTPGEAIRVEVRSTVDNGIYAEHTGFILQYRRK